MIIDGHSHWVPGLEKQFQQGFDQANLDYAVVMVLPSAMTTDELGEYQLVISEENLERMKQDNLVLAKSCENKRCRIPFAWLDYRMNDATGFLRTLVTDYGFKGLKIHQVFNGAADKNYYPLVETAVKLKIPVMVHTGFRAPARVDYVGELADNFEDGTFISAHMNEEYGLNRRFSHIRMVENCKYDNVYLECSYVSSIRRLKDAVDKLGSDKIVFGSDYPLWHADVEYCKTVVTRANISDEAKSNILGLNMKRILNL